MRYKVYWTRTAVKDLKKIDKKVVERIIEQVEEATLNPFRYFKKLRAMPLYSLRIGDYRVIASLDHEKRTIVVLIVEHRGIVYRRFK